MAKNISNAVLVSTSAHSGSTITTVNIAIGETFTDSGKVKTVFVTFRLPLKVKDLSVATICETLRTAVLADQKKTRLSVVVFKLAKPKVALSKDINVVESEIYTGAELADLLERIDSDDGLTTAERSAALASTNGQPTN